MFGITFCDLNKLWESYCHCQPLKSGAPINLGKGTSHMVATSDKLTGKLQGWIASTWPSDGCSTWDNPKMSFLFGLMLQSLALSSTGSRWDHTAWQFQRAYPWLMKKGVLPPCLLGMIIVHDGANSFHRQVQQVKERSA